MNRHVYSVGSAAALRHAFQLFFPRIAVISKFGFFLYITSYVCVVDCVVQLYVFSEYA